VAAAEAAAWARRVREAEEREARVARLLAEAEARMAVQLCVSNALLVITERYGGGFARTRAR
jgi:hypothetical protein